MVEKWDKGLGVKGLMLYTKVLKTVRIVVSMGILYLQLVFSSSVAFNP